MNKKFYDFTFSQKSIWDEECFFKKSPLNNIAAFLVIDGDVNFKKIKKAKIMIVLGLNYIKIIAVMLNNILNHFIIKILNY